MIRCRISRWSPELHFELVAAVNYAAVPEAGSFVHFRANGDPDSGRVIQVSYHPDEDQPIVWVSMGRELELARLIAMHRSHDMMMAEYMLEHSTARPSNMTAMALMLWNAERIEVEREKMRQRS
jgi:hypothetical protein